MDSSACYYLTSCTVACLAIRNLIRHRLYNSQSTISTSRFIRLLILCVVAGGVPFLARLLSYLVPLPTSRMPSWPWSAVHKNFRTIPSIPYSHQTPEQRRAFVTDVWVHIITGTLCFCIWVATDDVREDLSKAWSLCTRRICGLHGLRHADSPSPSPPSLDSPIAESRPAFSASHLLQRGTRALQIRPVPLSA